MQRQKDCTNHPNRCFLYHRIYYVFFHFKTQFSKIANQRVNLTGGTLRQNPIYWPGKLPFSLLPDASRRQQRAADFIRRSLGAPRLTTSEFT